MKKVIFIFVLSFFVNDLFSQNSYYVQFKDKNGTEFSLKNPQKYLSQRAIQRRANQNIAIDSTDLPVSKKYLNLLKNCGVEIVFTTKWLNGATILADTLQIKQVENLPFVEFTQLTKRAISSENLPKKNKKADTDTISLLNSITQHKMLGLDSLHAVGWRGKGMLIAVLDGGFPSVNEILAFDSIRPRILDTYNFVDNNADVYQRGMHGTMVLSTIGANLPDFIGSAPDASFLLYITEDVVSETLRETDNWAAAAERADSIGTDIINVSLGYTVFNDENDNFTYSDLDGKTTRISRAAEIAAQKGILVFIAAGNEGNKSWHYITAPADAEHVVTVGAVDSLQNNSVFSSFGPSADGRVKPTICAQGTQTTFVSAENEIFKGNGTSFATPVAAGMAASIWSAFPNLTNFELIEKIIQSAHQYENPDILCGYGIPNVWQIYKSQKEKNGFISENEIYFAQIKYNFLFIQTLKSNDYQFYLCDILGRKILSDKGNGNSTFFLPILSQGIYILKIFDKTIAKPQTFKLLKM